MATGRLRGGGGRAGGGRAGGGLGGRPGRCLRARRRNPCVMARMPLHPQQIRHDRDSRRRARCMMA
ncbi:MAG: hypothetical protein AVDCRST_MAG67-1197 [uncultured Solirubrobacteraceae bacterium]|uniref:Uncharacterized protein n=1 Tax=uncultured Solirubrobacteraceae bacterium TaxID=1162706 RepID=A0A6J4S2Y4_9ACTN|nr:MAG: hypothetical protein AVDCRST_MAG67-1197 [uncultured Solirubrobacteraceae bacterium]